MTEYRIPQFQWNSLSYLTARAGRIGTQELTELMESESLARHHFTIICALAEFGGISQNELAARSNLNRGHLVAYLDQLSSRGILERNVDPKDRRRNLITLTAEGQEFAARPMSAAKHNEAKAFGALDEQQKKQLRNLLQLVAAQDGEGRR